MNTDPDVINVKQLRAELPRIIRRIREGRRYLVLYRSRPAFEMTPADAEAVELPPLDLDPVFRSGSLGRSDDGLDAAGHDRTLYEA